MPVESIPTPASVVSALTASVLIGVPTGPSVKRRKGIAAHRLDLPPQWLSGTS